MPLATRVIEAQLTCPVNSFVQRSTAVQFVLLDEVGTLGATHIRNYSSTIPEDLELMLYNIYKSHNEVLYKILGRKIDIWENYYDRLKSAV